MIDFANLLQTLHNAEVEYIIVGGVAATFHGSARLTSDLGVVYGRNDENIEHIVEALRSATPYPRGAPAGLPFEWSAATLKAGLNFTLITSMGAVDLLGEVTGGGSFEDLLPHTLIAETFGVPCRYVGLKTLIKLKRAAGRPKDFEAISELEALLDEDSDSR